MSKKYKLIKWYPAHWGLLKEANIAQERKDHYQVNNGDVVGLKLSKKEVENNPEFWELVEEKDYKILSFTYCGDIYKPRNEKESQRNTWYNDRGAWLPLTPNRTTHSVKRLSDGEVFTVGDKIYCCGSIGTIEKLTLVDNRIRLDTDYAGRPFLADFIQHAKKPLFTTEDGVDIYEGDKFCVINSANDRIYDRLGGDGLFYKSEEVRKRCFSTKEKAQEWIDLNKPQYSKADITNAVHAVGELGYNHHSNKTCLILQADDLFKELKI